MWLFMFIVSLLINVFFLFYIRWLLKTIESVNEDIMSVSILINDFSLHLKNIYELEMFYGDETLGSLMAHSKELIEKIEGIDLIVAEPEKIKEESELLDE